MINCRNILVVEVQRDSLYDESGVMCYEYNIVRRLSRIDVTSPANEVYRDINYTYDPVGNVTQVTSSCPWLQNHTFSETFTYDASDQLVSATEMQNQSYSLSVNYGNWGKISGYTLNQKDLLHNTSQSEAQSYTYPATNSIGSSQTLFAPASRTIQGGQHPHSVQSFTFGINGSLRKREVQGVVPHTEHYLFNSAANLKAYSNNGLDFAYYGYNASNTRTYKLSMLNMHQWVNGQPEPLHLQLQSAMFYPNAYINFNQNGEYTKHYYNGSERIASRLGDNQQTIEAEANDRLLSRIAQTDELFKAQIGEMAAYEEPAVNVPARGNGEGTRNLLFPSVGYDPIPAFTDLQPTGNATDIFYYHTNHLGSTAFVTDQNQNITQGFLYAPFGEITTEYNANFGYNVLPKYSFNAKELDEETGMYYYEARYYKPPVFTSRDPMFEKYFWMTPYAYCANNPVKYVDPTGKVIPFPVWAVVGAALEYGFQVYDNYNDGKTGYDAWVNNIDFTDVLVSAINPSGKYKVAGIMLEEAIIAAFDISINEGVKINRDVKDVAKKTVVNTVVSVEMGKVTKASSETALQNANKEVNTASENLNRAKHKAQRSPNSVKKAENVRTAQNNVQYARNKQVRTQMMYYTVGQVPNATEYGVSALIKKSLEDKKATQQQVP